MTKEELIRHIEGLVSQDVISKDDLLNAYENGQKLKGVGITSRGFSELEYLRPGTRLSQNESDLRAPSLSHVISYIGGFIVVLGIAVLINQNWDQLNDFVKITSTFGAALAAFFVGVVFGKRKLAGVSQAFFLISAMVMPIGLFVIFDIMNYLFTAGVNSAVSALLFLFYLLAFLYLRENIFVIFLVVFGSWLFVSLTAFLAEDRVLVTEDKFFQYRFLVLGLSYLFLGNHFLSSEARNKISGFLFSFGSLFFLGSALALGGWSPNQNVFWELAYPAFIFAFLFLSVHLKSRSLLAFGALSLMAYVIKITAEYFSDNLGWPLSLVIVGLCLIAVGYYSFYLNRKYISS